MGLGQLLSVAAALSAPVFMNHWGVMRAFYLASVGQGICMAVMALFRPPLAAALGFAGSSVMVSMIAPARGVASQESVLPRWGAAMSAAVTIGLVLGWSVEAM